MFERAISHDALKIATLLSTYLKLDAWEAFKIAVESDARDCISYFSQFVKIDKITVASWLEEPKIKTVAFLYTHGFLSYEACFVFAYREKGKEIVELVARRKSN